MIKKISVLLLFVLLSACTQNNDGASVKNEDRKGTNLLLNPNERPERRDADPIMDRTMDAQNPNFPNFEGNRNDIGKDVDKARQVIRDSGEFNPGSIWVTGQNMTVTVKSKGGMSQKEKNDAKARIHKKLIKALPRYLIEVRVADDRS